MLGAKNATEAKWGSGNEDTETTRLRACQLEKLTLPKDRFVCAEQPVSVHPGVECSAVILEPL